MSDTFSAACGPSTRNGYIRGSDEAFREAQGAGATPTTRGETAGCGAPASGGRTAGGRLTPDSDALGEAAPARRTGGAASSRALRAPGAAVRIAARGAGAVAEGRVASAAGCAARPGRALRRRRGCFGWFHRLRFRVKPWIELPTGTATSQFPATTAGDGARLRSASVLV